LWYCQPAKVWFPAKFLASSGGSKGGGSANHDDFRIISAMRRNTTRRNATWQNILAQFGIGAGALLLPPLVLGAAFYSMLAAPEEEVTRPGAVRAAPGAPLIAPPATVAAAPAATVPRPAGKPADEVTLTSERVPVQVSPVQVAATPAAAVNLPAYVEGSATPPAESPAPATAKRVVHRHARPQQDPFPLKNWLQQIGILPRNGKDARDTRG
jgi:hypothetical protein